MNFSLNEQDTILCALKYMKANRDDVIRAFSEEDDATGENTWPVVLSEEEITTLINKIEKPDTIQVFVAFDIAGHVKGIMLDPPLKHPWWSSSRWIEVPKADWDAEKVTTATILSYQYSVNKERKSL